MYSTPVIVHTISQQHFMYNTPLILLTISQQHIKYTTPMIVHTVCQQHITYSTLTIVHTVSQQSLRIVHRWFSTPSLNSGHVNGLRKGEIGMASWVSRLRKSVIACFPWKVRKGWLTHKQTEWSLLLFFQCALKERTEQGVLKTARATHSTLPCATAPQGHVSARQDGKERHAVTMLMSAIHHLPHSQCVLITQCAPILMEVSYVSAWKDSTSRKACVSVKTNLFLPYILSFSFLFLLLPLL